MNRAFLTQLGKDPRIAQGAASDNQPLNIGSRLEQLMIASSIDDIAGKKEKEIMEV